MSAHLDETAETKLLLLSLVLAAVLAEAVTAAIAVSHFRKETVLKGLFATGVLADETQVTRNWDLGTSNAFWTLAVF